jgi:hypothetical protein
LRRLRKFLTLDLAAPRVEIADYRAGVYSSRVTTSAQAARSRPSAGPSHSEQRRDLKREHRRIAHDLVFEHEAAARRQRLDDDLDPRELAGAAPVCFLWVKSIVAARVIVSR